MSTKSNATHTIDTCGKAKFIRNFQKVIGEAGLTVDLSEIQFEVVVGITTSIIIENFGTSAVYVAFDSSHDDMDLTDWLTYNLKLFASVPFSKVSIPAEASHISFKCAVNQATNIDLIVW